MAAPISRELLIDRLGTVQRDRFLLYLMGPYKSFNLEYVLSEEERAGIDIQDLPGPIRDLFQHRDEIDEAHALLRRVQGSLRADPGVNAFLAVDLDVDTDDIDAATQSIAYAKCANLTVFVLPFLGHNFGVGEEAGSILEALSDPSGALENDYGERLVFARDSQVTSEMIRSARQRWDVTLLTYETETELLTKIRQQTRTIMERERYGDLERLDDGD